MAYKRPITSPQHPTNILDDKFINQKPVKTKKRGRRRKTRKRSVSAVRSKTKPQTMKDLSSSLRMECLRLADFIKQGAYRKASVL